MKTLKIIFFCFIAAFIMAALSLAHPAPPVAKGPKPLPKAQPVKSSTSTDNPLVDFEADIISRRGAYDSTIYLVGNVKFHHNGAIIECDSAARYDANRMDFFGKVIINKDSAYIYGDRVNYDGRTSMAEVLAPLVKMMRGDVTMYSYNLRFNTKTNIATFSGGGVMTQKSNFMESYRGEYNADLNIVKFLDSVAMRSDSYTIKTDSLSYNLDSETATFLAPSIVWDKDSSILVARRGFYFSKNQTYEFTDSAYVVTKDQEMWADTMTYYQPMRQATMVRNVQVLDTTQRTIALSDWAYYDDSLGVAILTRMPSVRGYNEDKSDTTYVRADSIFMLTFEPGKAPRAYANNGDSTLSEELLQNDSLPIRNNISTPDSLAKRDSLPVGDTLPALDSMQMRDNLPITDSLKLLETTAIKDSLPAKDSLPTMGSLPINDSLPMVDSLPMGDSLLRDSLSVGDSLPMRDSLPKTQQKKPEKERIVRAYHNVRSWAKDYQGICDSLVGYSPDSMAQMFGKPVIWSQNNQITADQIDVYSTNEELDWIDFIGSPFITQKIEPKWIEPEDSSRFNQASGREMQAYFKNNELDSAVMSGNVQNYYYMESDGYTSAFATITCPRLVIFFDGREPIKMRWENDTKFSIYPLDQIPAGNTQRLEGFSWQQDRRPKSAKEISDRILRPSRRLETEAITKPLFPIEEQINQYKKSLLDASAWRDRSEQTTVTPEYFESQSTML